MDLLLVGDVMLGRLVNDVLRREPPTYPWGDTLPLFQAADFRICNLECVLSDRGSPWSATPKLFHFRSDAKNVAVLKAAGMDAVSLANNHTLDYKDVALLDMLDILDAAGIQRAGVGRDAAEAARPAIARVQGHAIGLVAFTDNEPGWEATADRPGVLHVPVDVRDERAQRLFATIRAVKDRCDLLVASAHWGPNWGYAPPSSHVVFGRALVDAGADVVFGHSGHVFRGIEAYRGRPIIYCAGDFIDDYAVDPVERNDRSFIFVLETDGRQVQRLRLRPTVIRDFQARLATGNEAQQIAAKMEALCAAFGTRTAWHEDDSSLQVALA
jgi:poly-gamma-glutamate capsule biosynthesis protein CapA/YwtB (metallophosphatase superfamily)